MTALGKDRNTQTRDAVQYEYPVAADKKIYAGSLVVLDTAGNAEPATTATGKICVGRADELCDNSGGLAAAKKVKVRAGCFKWANGDAITKTSIGDQAYAVDDQTVAKASAGKSAVGVIVDVDTDGVWVNTAAPLLAASTGLLAANNLSDLGTAATARDNLGFDVHEKQITFLRKVETVAANLKTVGVTDGSEIILAAADNDVVQLPDAAAGNKGMVITVVNAAADGAAKVSVSPHASDAIYGGIHGAAGGDLVSFSGVVNKDIINTKATTKKGDYAVLVSDGVGAWYVIGGKGVWASEA